MSEKEFDEEVLNGLGIVVDDGESGESYSEDYDSEDYEDFEEKIHRIFRGNKQMGEFLFTYSKHWGLTLYYRDHRVYSAEETPRHNVLYVYRDYIVEADRKFNAREKFLKFPGCRGDIIDDADIKVFKNVYEKKENFKNMRFLVEHNDTVVELTLKLAKEWGWLR